ncbi:MAG: metallophosphoesterase [Planctomycetes bacterium]|nr:metallophosphoesterase [Planctomycetota bacterium]
MSAVGILADSHGHAETTARAVRALEDAGAELLVHLGDVETEAVIDELVGRRAHLVFGNCDFDTDALARYAGHVGVQVDGLVGQIEVDGRRITFTHGHLRPPMDAAITAGDHYLLHGHTHELRDERIGGTRVINPGALFRAARYTAVVLDPAQDRLEVLDVGKS